MKLRSKFNLGTLKDDVLVGFFYAVSNEEPPPFSMRDNLYIERDYDDYCVSACDDPRDDDDYVNLEIGDRMYKYSDVVRMYEQLMDEESFDPDTEKFYVYINESTIMDIRDLMETDQ